MTIQEYLENINKRFITGISREHSYRGDLQTLLESLASGVLVTNEPARIKCGAPDFIITKQEIPVGYIEAKDIGKDLSGKEFKEQFSRYRKSLNNLIITDYLEFRLYVDGEFVTSRKIAEIEDGKIKPLPENFEQFTTLVKDFCTRTGQTITNSKKLAEMMAGKAQILASVIEEALNSDEETNANSTLKDQMQAFQDVLIHDITPKEFADIYAQTIAYGMFAARLHDPHLPSFSRQEAAELIPKSNPFLRKLFQHIAGYDLDDRIKWIVDALADIFRATDVNALLKNFGKATQANDPIIHFYETFLAEYDPKLRKSRGVWYTPEPVVNFIVRAVDDILKTEFGLKQGLADTSKTTVQVKTQTRDERTKSGYKEIEKEVHKVQILDPATGTGTFLAEVVKQIYKKFEGQEGIWSKYVEDDLIPRLNGFELLMASYTMAHLKLDMLLSETGYKPTADQRFKIYLTNSLEEHHPDTGTLFAGWLSREANEANHIKRDTPVMCVIGNPPYSVSSSNKSEWIEELMVDYKKDLNDKNIQPLSDDYLKFIRFGQHFIENNGEGILAYISNNSFIDGLIHRQMRKNLLESFDKIYIIDLHGNYKKKETALDGSKDENVFDIQQGVSINIFVKSKDSVNKSCEVWKHDILGKRQIKYDNLINSSMNSIKWEKIEPIGSQYLFREFDNMLNFEYEKNLSLNELFLENGAGVQTKRDKIFVEFEINELKDRINKILENQLEDSEKQELNIKNSSSYRLLEKIEASDFDLSFIRKYNYRTFDDRYIYYDKNLLGRAFFNIMQNMLQPNFGLITCKQQSSFDFQHCFITKELTDHNSISLQTREASYFFPLYLYPETDGQQENFLKTAERTPNLNEEIVEEIAGKLGLKFVSEKEETTRELEETTTPSNEAFATPPLEGGEFKTEKTLTLEGDELKTKNSPLLEGGELKTKNSSPLEGDELKTKNSPPSKGGVPEGWGGCLQTFAPIDILDYIYAVLHSPNYREKYKEFLKIDFPRVPYPKDAETFWKLVNLGGELRKIHLLESPKVEEFITSYPKDGDNIVTRKMTKTSVGFEENVRVAQERATTSSAEAAATPPLEGGELREEILGKVWINDEQYFDNVPKTAWEFYIGGYQPAQKWLKDRNGRELIFEDIRHYQKIIVALNETDRLMKEIDKIELE